MLGESMLIVPKKDNDGGDLSALADRVALELTSDFGGCTASNAAGMWAHDGTLFKEPVTELVAACAETATNDSKLESLAREIGRDGKQKAVYVRFADGRVEILDTSPPKAANSANDSRLAA